MIFASKHASTQHAVRADRGEDDRVSRNYVEPSPCVVIPAVDLSTLIPARFATPRTLVEYLT